SGVRTTGPVTCEEAGAGAAGSGAAAGAAFALRDLDRFAGALGGGSGGGASTCCGAAGARSAELFPPAQPARGASARTSRIRGRNFSKKHVAENVTVLIMRPS